jgi:hypothetical protein
LIAYADLATEMLEVKHPFQTGIAARADVDFQEDNELTIDLSAG